MRTFQKRSHFKYPLVTSMPQSRVLTAWVCFQTGLCRALLFGSGRSWRWTSVLEICRAGGVGAAGGVITGTLNMNPGLQMRMTRPTSCQMMPFHKQMPFHEDAQWTGNENIRVQGHVCKTEHLPGDSGPSQETAGGSTAWPQRSVVTDRPTWTLVEAQCLGVSPGGVFSLVPPSTGSGAMPYLHTLAKLH